MDSRLAGSMKLQVFTTRTSASSARGTISQPACASVPSISSLSTRFFGQPRLTIPTFGIVDFLLESQGQSFEPACRRQGRNEAPPRSRNERGYFTMFSKPVCC